MVQVDVFWAYGLGASLAAAAGRQLRREPRPFVTHYFVLTVLFLALVWAPTGLLLLLRHPSWETMQVAPSLSAIPPFVVLAFGVTNVTQGILGYWVGQRLMARGRSELAQLNWLAGYLGMFFILLYGWDGLGYDRFLYDRDMFNGVPWSPGAGLQRGAGPAILVSSVARTLYLDGVFLVPSLLVLFGRWSSEGARSVTSPQPAPTARAFAGLYLFAVFFLALPSAGALALGVHFSARLLRAFASPAVAHVAAYPLGMSVVALALWALFFAEGRPARALLRKLAHEPTPSPRPALATQRTADAT